MCCCDSFSVLNLTTSNGQEAVITMLLPSFSNCTLFQHQETSSSAAFFPFRIAQCPFSCVRPSDGNCTIQHVHCRSFRLNAGSPRRAARPLCSPPCDLLARRQSGGRNTSESKQVEFRFKNTHRKKKRGLGGGGLGARGCSVYDPKWR